MKRLWLLLLCIGTSNSLADIVWRGNFETGDRSQWSGTEMVSSDRLQIVESPVREGRYALRALVKQYDNPIHASGNRNELFYNSNEPLSSEYYYRWSTMFDESFPSHPSWAVFTQWHQSALCCGSPPVSFFVKGENIYLAIMDQPVWSAPLRRGVWHDFVFHVRWSDTPSVGFIELYYDGELVIPRRSAATNMPGQLNYLKQGLYRDEVIAPDGIVYHDAMVQATSLNDVMPPAPVTPPDAGTPPAGNPPAGADGGIAGNQAPGTSVAPLPSNNGVNATGGCSTSGALLVPLMLVLVPGFFLLRLISRAAPQRLRLKQRRQPRS